MKRHPRILQMQREQHRIEAEAEEYKLRYCYGELLDGLERLQQIIEQANTTNANEVIAAAKIAAESIRLGDQGAWHLFLAEQKALRKKHADERAKLRRRLAISS